MSRNYEISGYTLTEIGHPRAQKLSRKEWALIISGSVVGLIALAAIVLTWHY